MCEGSSNFSSLHNTNKVMGLVVNFMFVKLVKVLIQIFILIKKK